MIKERLDDSELMDSPLEVFSEPETADLPLEKGEVPICLRSMKIKTLELLGVTLEDRLQGVKVTAALHKKGVGITLRKLIPQEGQPGVFAAEERIILPGSPLYPVLYALSSFGRDLRKLLNNKVGLRKSLTAVRRKEKQESAGLEASA